MIDKTVGAFLDEVARKYPDHDAVVYPIEGIRYTYAEFNEMCNRIARGLMAIGVRKGEHVSIWATNRVEWLLLQFATAKIGAVLVTVNTNYKVYELEYLLKQSDTESFFLIDGFKDVDYVKTLYRLVPELRESEPGKVKSERLKRLRRVVYIGDKPAPKGMLHWSQLLELSEEVSEEEFLQRQSSLDVHDVVNMQYTSGTTGFPKGVQLTHYNILNNGKAIGDCMNFTTKDRLCIPVPLFHCFGCVLGVMACVTHASTMVPVDYFRPKWVLEALSKERCTAIHGVPTMFIAVLGHPDFDKYDLSNLRTGIMAGSTCPTEVMKAAINRMGVREITSAYGQTEASPVITQTRTTDPVDIRITTVGRVLPSVEAKIVDVETRQEVPAGVQGEVCTRGYHVMKGYYNMPEATAQVIDEDGWLYTGDLGVQTEDGYFTITGRAKDMIIRGGENIYPREIEEFLYTHPSISDVQVVGVPDANYGEEIMAFVCLKEGHSCTEEEIQQYVKENMARHKVPRYVRFVTEYPTTASGKVQKYKLREMGVELLRLHDETRVETA
ncbi:MAG: AMP-binding protein [Limnochordia bacterium]|nr:AMP-binding protein [Limnochordia bacterium]MDD2630715.1 AMP-binding protein [Limnochordia bacterium]MDD4518227.1 AMP-binding protein [Limnochordia bacterium]